MTVDAYVADIAAVDGDVVEVYPSALPCWQTIMQESDVGE